ncbi:C40 family peptidase [Flavobacterium sp. xlx-214]|nr:C40 family peptidase [Flavobacterium sp. xlx-214]MBA5793968.1 C40 family peptidase [Flavobacterium sp. xlx-221]QMI82661.1 C40 family peptidase [Flavobacterium sp. xlx-214]
MIFAVCLFLGSCKSKTDWRDNYNKNKTSSKNTVKKTVVEKPNSINDFAKLLDTDISVLENKKLYQFIINWYGTPYQYGGQTSDGIDCSAFTNVLYKEIYKKQLPRSSKDIAEETNRKYAKDLQEGDLVFFAFGKSRTINHVGVYLHNNKFVHASTSKGVIISDLTEPWYNDYLVKCGSLK